MAKSFEQLNKEKIPDTEIARKLQETIKEEKAEKGEPTNNPETIDEVQRDLKRMGVVKKDEKEGWASVTKEDAEKIVNALEKAISEQKETGEIVPQNLGAAAKKESKEDAVRKPYIYQEIDRLGKELVIYKNRAKNSNSPEAKAVYEEKFKSFREELEKAKAARDKMKEEGRQKQKNTSELEADIAESQPKTYGEKVYSWENIPEDRSEFNKP